MISSKFSIFKKKHHCFHCGHVLCRSCLGESQIAMPRFNYESPKPICTGCYPYFVSKNQSNSLVTGMTEAQLMELMVKQLKDYISLYNISSAAGSVVEKADLVHLIKSTELTEENQVSFRSKIKQFSLKSRSVENLLNDIFSTPSSSNSASGSSQPRWQQNISNILPIFFQELFPMQSSTETHQEPRQSGMHPQNEYPGNTSYSRSQAQNNDQSFRSHPYAPPGTYPQTSTPPRSTTPVSAPKDIPTVPQIIKENIDIKTLNSRTIKAILSKYNVNYAGILEKSELEERLATLIQNMRLEALQANEDLIW